MNLKKERDDCLEEDGANRMRKGDKEGLMLKHMMEACVYMYDNTCWLICIKMSRAVICCKNIMAMIIIIEMLYHEF